MRAACYCKQLSQVADRLASEQPGCVIHPSKTSLCLEYVSNFSHGGCFCNRGNTL